MTFCVCVCVCVRVSSLCLCLSFLAELQTICKLFHARIAGLESDKYDLEWTRNMKEFQVIVHIIHHKNSKQSKSNNQPLSPSYNDTTIYQLNIFT